MQKTVEEQIKNRCIHFTGIMQDRCKKEIFYKDVKEGKPILLPCLNQLNNCPLREFPSDEEVAKQANEINSFSDKVINVYKQVEQSGKESGKVKCLCGGEVTFVKDKYNGHLRAKCDKCEISMFE